MKTYKERTQDILHRAEEKKKLRRKIRIVSVGTICISILIAFNLILFIPYSTTCPISPRTKTANITASCNS